MKNMIYFDNAATTSVRIEAVKAMSRALDEFGNPSSSHILGSLAKKNLNEARKKIEKILNADEGTFYFTSGATEANNWAVVGSSLFNRKRGNHILTTVTEHPSVLEPIKHLEKNGFEVSRVGVDKNGRIDIDNFCANMRKDTVLASVMHVNNETGVINDISAIGKGIKAINKETIFHVDGVCSFCKIPISIEWIDLLSVSGHKLHTPKGVGGLYIKKGTRIAPLIFGGGQQQGLRAGTENTPGAEAFAASAFACDNEGSENYESTLQLKKRLINGVSKFGFSEIIGTKDDDKASPYIVNIGFRGVKSQLVVNALEESGIFVSGGSACSNNKDMRNKSISALGIDDELIEGAVRFSFSKYNTMLEIDICLEALDDIFKRYRG